MGAGFAADSLQRQQGGTAPSPGITVFLPRGAAMFGAMKQHLTQQLADIQTAGLFKHERVLTSPQRAHVGVPSRPDVLNMCANNYLGLASHPDVVVAAHAALDRWGYGLASVRFICGTQEPHKELERKLAE